jgi:hypothetical protein
MKFKLISDSGQISSKLLFFSHSNDTENPCKTCQKPVLWGIKAMGRGDFADKLQNNASESSLA